MDNKKNSGRVTIPTDVDVIDQTIETMKRWGADAIRDCDGTQFPKELSDTGAKVYATYYTTRKDNEWAKNNPDEIQQCYIMTKFHTAFSTELRIHLLEGISDQLLLVNSRDDIKRWWEVIDRSTGEVISVDNWNYDDKSGDVTINNTELYHEYTVSFLAYLIWDPVHMYNAVINDWQNFEHQITFDVRQPKTKEYSMKRLRKFIEENPYVDVIRYTTFFHQFTLIFDELRREKYVDWYGYSASVSPYILEQFEKEAGYKFRAEYIIDQGYYNSQYRIPTKEFKDFMRFQNREVCKLAKEMVDITHECGKEAMMFLGDHWIGTEPYLDDFKNIGLDAVVGSAGDGITLRLISDIKGVKYTEGRFLPYFFPDTFHEGGDPVKEAKINWIKSRRAMLRSTVDRIGYGGYLGLALKFPEFIDYIEEVCNEFRNFYDIIKNKKAFSFKRVAILNAWGRSRSWGCHMVHHGVFHKQNKAYSGVIESLAGAPFDVQFISFDDILENPKILDDIDVILNTGEGDTAHGGGDYWTNEKIYTAIRAFIANGGGFIGVGEPSAHQWQGHYFQLSTALGVERERGFNLGYDKYNWDEKEHFITAEWNDRQSIDFGEGARNVFALEEAQVLVQQNKEVKLAVNEFGKGRTVYLSGLPYSFENTRLLHRAILWSSNSENELNKWFSENYYVDVHAYDSGKFCVVNNSYDPQSTKVYKGNGEAFDISLGSGEIRWFDI